MTLDTPGNRKGMPDADHTQWTPLEYVAKWVKLHFVVSLISWGSGAKYTQWAALFPILLWRLINRECKVFDLFITEWFFYFVFGIYGCVPITAVWDVETLFSHKGNSRDVWQWFTAPFNNVRTVKLKARPTNLCVFRYRHSNVRQHLPASTELSAR